MYAAVAIVPLVPPPPPPLLRPRQGLAIPRNRLFVFDRLHLKVARGNAS